MIWKRIALGYMAGTLMAGAAGWILKLMPAAATRDGPGFQPAVPPLVLACILGLGLAAVALIGAAVTLFHEETR